MHKLLIVFWGIILISCHKKEIDQRLIGDWKLIKEEIKTTLYPYIPPPNYHPYGFSIQQNNTFENYNGFFEMAKDSITKDLQLNFLGNFTKYKIEKDSFLVYDLQKKLWISNKFLFKGNDTLVLQKDSTIVKFKRQTYNLDTMPKFDQIVLSTTGCYGTCPISDISISKTGEVAYIGEGFTGKNGYFTSTISSEKFSFLQDKFRKADIKNIKTEFGGGKDNEIIYVTFIKDGKIFKTISDYLSLDCIAELYWAYVPLRFLYSEINLQPIDTATAPVYYRRHWIQIENDKRILELGKSESFLLWNYWRLGNRINKVVFNPKYLVKFDMNLIYWGATDLLYGKPLNQNISIKTDGRYFRFFNKGNVMKTIDIGFNFIETNYNASSFKEKPSKYNIEP